MRDSRKFVMLWVGLFSSGFIEFCNINNILTESFWCVVSPVAFSITIALQSVENSPHTLEYLTWFSSWLVVPIIILSVVVALHRQAAYSKGEARGAKSKARPVKERNPKDADDQPINPMYHDISVYDTLTPGVIAWLLVFQGVIWWEMAFRWQANEKLGLTTSVRTEGLLLTHDSSHEAHGILAQLICDIFISVCILAFFSVSCKILEKSKLMGSISSEREISSLDTQNVLYTHTHAL